MKKIYTIVGVGAVLDVYEDRITITPNGIKGLLFKGVKGSNEILFTSITSIQFKTAGLMFNGFLRFTIPGATGRDDEKLFVNMRDENTFIFKLSLVDFNINSKMREIKVYIDNAIHKPKALHYQKIGTNLSEEIAKLAQMKANGILSEEEFQAAKRKLFG